MSKLLANLPTQLDNLAVLLPALLTIDRNPMSLKNHFPFEEAFSLRTPRKIVHRSSRQIGKTRQIAARMILECAFRPNHKVLVVTPLQEQSDTLSSTIFRPMLEDSPIRSILCPGDSFGSVRRRDFTNGAFISYSYAGQSVSRARSKTARCLMVDEAQDMEAAHLPVLTQCLSAYNDRVVWVSGTSKTKDTLLENEWLASSQGIWHTKCHACGFDNIAALEIEGGHLLSMIGPYHDNISEKEPATQCHRCLRKINPRYGRWVHRFPERQAEHIGFYAPQPIFPFHYAQPQNWKDLLKYQRGMGGYTTAKFYNEVLGEAYDLAYKLVSIDDLKRAAQLGPNTVEEAAKRCTRYPTVVLGIDWGGGGDDGVSRTKGAAVGIAPDGKTDVFFGFQFQPSTDRVQEAKDIIKMAKVCRASIIAHDVQGGIGTASEAALTHLGWPVERIAPMAYAGVTGGGMVEFRHPGQLRRRGYYVMHKAQTLQFLTTAIREGLIRFFEYDRIDANDPGLLSDFLSLVEDKVDTPTGNNYHIRRMSKTMSDDFTSAVNYATAALWELTNRWPANVQHTLPLWN